jgi:hypothetical protein
LFGPKGGGMDQYPLYWAWLTGAQWELAASVATVAGIVLGLAAGIIAFISYRATNRSAENAHMHTLFSDYLRLRFDYLMHKDMAVASAGATTGSSEPASELDEEVASIKLYVLEEMWVWIDRQESDPLHLLHWSPTSRARLKESLQAWKATIFSHIDDDEDVVLLSIHRFTPCYSLGFLRFLAGHWPERGGFFDMVHGQETALIRKTHKAMGFRFRDLKEKRLAQTAQAEARGARALGAGADRDR